ncbi:unnamed protein product [Blepharisma stoltei]|uniref:Uncharacterized protein n=1 Tax=Blepharisma stoltei TaxID=1481888 RepID=A0AAU9IYG6_9CILI|nr:unnamed protein product [Blepharisma stoltei]
MTKFSLFALFWMILSCAVLFLKYWDKDYLDKFIKRNKRNIDLGPLMYFDPPDAGNKTAVDEITYDNVFKLYDIYDLKCSPFSFGYNREEAEALFPSYDFPSCFSQITQPKWKIVDRVFSMKCHNYSRAAIVQGPTGKVKFPSWKIHQGLWQAESFEEKEKLNKNTDFLLATCDYSNNFEVAWHRPIYNPELHWNAQCLSHREKLPKPLFILTLGLDSFSRRHFFQKLPETVKVINSFAEKFKIYDFKLHNIAGKATVENITPIFIDDKYAKKLKASTKKDKMGGRAIWVDFKNRGFITSLLTDDCDYRVYDNIGPQPNIDYVSRQFFCAATKFTNYITEKNEKLKQRCIGTQMSHTYIFQYLNDLLDMYQDVSHWSYVHFNAAHEATGRHAQTLDPDLSEFLLTFLPKVSKTHDVMINLLGDHGMRYGNYKTSVNGDQEMKLPVFIMIISEYFIKSVLSDEILQINTERLVTKQDIRQTFLEILNRIDYTRRSKNKHAYDLFTAEIPLNRNCDVNAHIPMRYCACLSYREIKPEFWHAKSFKELVDDLIRIACDQINAAVHTPDVSSFMLCQKVDVGEIIGVFHNPNFSFLSMRIEFKAKYSHARFLAEYRIHIDNKDLYGVPIIFNYQRLLVQIAMITRQDAYAGPCEEKSNKLGVRPDYCICEYDTKA